MSDEPAESKTGEPGASAPVEPADVLDLCQKRVVVAMEWLAARKDPESNADNLTESERRLADALAASLHLTARATLLLDPLQAEREQFSAMLRDFSAWSEVVCALLREAAGALEGTCRVPGVRTSHVRPLAARCRQMADAVKGPDELEASLNREMLVRAAKMKPE